MSSKTIVTSISILINRHYPNHDEIVPANWPNDKHIICNVNNDIRVKIPSHLYVLINKSVLCNCGIEAANHHLLESIAACDNRDSKLV